MQDNSTIKTPNIEELVKKAQEIYEKIRLEVEPKENGKYIAIETNSEKYFIGNTRDEATSKAHSVFPNAIVFVNRIGGIEKVARHSPYSSSSEQYVRLF